MIKRFLNIVIFIILPVCVYITFSIKNQVYEMQKQADMLQAKIEHEREIINVYRVQWASISSAGNISKLHKQLMPDYKTVDYTQMQTAENLVGTSDVYVAWAKESDTKHDNHSTQ
jgi:hypothetical protein